MNNFEGDLKKHFKYNVLNFRPRVLNIQALDIARKAKGLTTRPALYILKHIWKMDTEKVKKLFTISRGLSQKERKTLVSQALDYMRRYDSHFDWNIIQELEQSVLRKGETAMVTLLQGSLDEAREKGLKQGIRKGMSSGH